MRSNQSTVPLYQSKCAKEHDKTSVLTRDKFSLVHDLGPSGYLRRPWNSKLSWTQCRCKVTILDNCFIEATSALQRAPNLSYIFVIKVLYYKRLVEVHINNHSSFKRCGRIGEDRTKFAARKCLRCGCLSVYYHRLRLSSRRLSWNGIV